MVVLKIGHSEAGAAAGNFDRQPAEELALAVDQARLAAVDPSRLHQALLNLLKNAHESGSWPDHVELQIRRVQDVIRIDVLDRGSGMNVMEFSHRSADFMALNAQAQADLRELLAIRKQLGNRLIANRPDVFIGVDAPDFNFGLEARLRAAGIKTVHFVCPSIWAWRGERVHKLAAAADHVLCLFPFEPALLEEQIGRAHV